MKRQLESNLKAIKEWQVFLEALQASLAVVMEPRFFDTERGYQGELAAELRNRLETISFDGDPVVEQEYQKRVKAHGIRIRPDVIIHIPFERGETEGTDDGNFVAMELKRRATGKTAQEAFDSLVTMKETLAYPLTIFVNIDSLQTYSELCPGSIADQTVCFAVKLENGTPVVRMDVCSR